MTAAQLPTDRDPRASRARLLDEIDPEHQLPEPVRRAFFDVPRHSFAPDRLWAQPEHGGPYKPVDRYTDPELWWEVVHSNRVLAIQYDDGHTVWPTTGNRITSSISKPSIVAAMLAMLDVQPADRVLEIGTGSGYTGALLAHLADKGQVITVEIDPRTARSASHLYRRMDLSNVAVWTNDGAQPLMPIAHRWDKVISTASAQTGRIPYSWIAESDPGAVIVTPMHTDLSPGPLIRLVVGQDGTATGHADHDMRVGFMELRSHRVPWSTSFLPTDYDTHSDVELSSTDLDPHQALLDTDHRWPLALAISSCHLIREGDDPDHPCAFWLTDPMTGAWARIAPAVLSERHFTVHQYGPRRLWDEAEAAYQWWHQHGSPRLDQWEWHVTATTQAVKLPH